MSRSSKKTKAQKQRGKRIARHQHLGLDFSDQLAGKFSEAAKRAGAAAGMLTLASTLGATPAHALPRNGSVVGGSASISTTNPTTLDIHQTTDSAIINWQGYSIASNELVHYTQPGSSSIVLNRVTGQDPSLIYGTLSGNGQVWVINQNGLLVGPNAKIQAGSFLASTMNIGNEDFAAGRYTLKNTPSSLSSIVNHGNIQVSDGGYLVLAAPSVTSTGSIVANLGKVRLASGDEIRLNFEGNDLIDLVVTGKVAADALGVKNAGLISADGGQVVLSAKVATDLLKNVVNNEGVIEAVSIREKNGTIILDGGSNGITANSGTLDASGKGAGETGGMVKVLGEKVGLFDAAKVDASGDAGGGTVLLGGSFQGIGPEQNAAASYLGKDAAIDVAAITHGDGGKAVVWSDDATRFYGNIGAQGGAQGGDGGSVEVSGKHHLDFQGAVDMRAAKGRTGTLLLDPTEISIRHGAAGTDADITVTGPLPFSDTSSGPASVLKDGTIGSQLATSNVVVSTALNDIVIDNAAGTVAIDPGAANTNTLTLNSAASISWNADWSYTNSGALALNANSAALSINETNPALTPGNYLGASDNISGSGVLAIGGGAPLLLQASGGGGTLGSPLNTAGLTKITASTGIGGLFISNAGSDVQVTGSGINSVKSLGGEIWLKNTGNITVDANAKIESTNGNVTLSAAGDLILGNATGNSLIYTYSGPGNLSLTAGGNVTLNRETLRSDAGSISVAAGRDLSITGDSSLKSGDTLGRGGGGAISLQTGDGAINLPLASLGEINTTGPVTMTTNHLANGANITQSGGSVTAGTLALNSAGDILQSGGVMNVTGNASMTAAGAITQSGTGAIGNAPLLTTRSSTGQTLNGANTVASFNATNVGGGDVSLTNTGATLTVTGINQTSGGNIRITNAGNIGTTGAIRTTGNVTLTTTGGTISETGAGAINNAALLTTSSFGGQALNGANTVSELNATNTGSGNIQLKNKVPVLTISGISETGGGNIAVDNNGAITTSDAITTSANGAITLTARGTETVNAVLTAGGGGTVTLVANGAASDLLIDAAVRSTSGWIYLTAGRAIAEGAGGTLGTSGVLKTQSVFGQTLNGANTVTGFSASNFGSGAIELANTTGELTVSGITEVAGGTVKVKNSGAIVLGGAVGTGAGGTVRLDTLGPGRITGAGLITADTVQLQTDANSSGAIGTVSQSINTAGNTSLGMGQGGSLTGAFINHGGALTLQAPSLAANSPLSVAASGLLTLPVTAIDTGNADLFLKSGTTLSTAADLSATTGNITLRGAQGITLGNTVDTAGNVTLNAAEGTITEEGAGAVSNAARLTTFSAGGQALNGANTVASFSGTSAGGGDIQLTNRKESFTVTGIDEKGGGDVRIVNAGNMRVAGTVNTTGNVTLSATGGTLRESGAGAVNNAALLTTSSTGGQALNGANTVASFNGSNAGGGNIALTNKSATLTITGIDETAGGAIRVTNSGNLSATGAINTTGTVTLTATGGTIAESGAGAVTNAALLTTSSSGGQELNGANTVASFSAGNAGSGNIEFANGAGTLRVAGIAEAAGGTVKVQNAGDISLDGAVNAGAGGTVRLDTLGPGLIKGAGLITADTVQLQTAAGSSGAIGTSGQSIGTAGTTSLSMGQGASLLGAFVSHSGALTLQAPSLAANSPLQVAASGLLTLPAAAIATGSADLFLKSGTTLSTAGVLSATTGNITLHGPNGITVGNTIGTAGNVALIATGGAITESGAGAVKNAALLTTVSAGRQLLNGANTVTSFNATKSGSGNLALTNTGAPLTVTGINEATGGNIRVTNTGNLGITGEINTTGNVTLTATGGTLAESGAGVISNAALLTTSSSGGQTLNGANTVASFNATNAGSGNIQLNNSAATLTINGLADFGGGNVTVGNDGGITVNGAVTTAANGNIGLTANGDEIFNAAVTAGGSGTVALTADGAHDIIINAALGSTSGGIDLSAGRAITEGAGGSLSTSGQLTTHSVAGQSLNRGNTVGGFNGTSTASGDIDLANSAALTIAGIRTADGDITVANSGSLTTTGAIATAANGNITLAASGTETIGAQVSAGGSGTVALSAAGETGDLLIDALVSSGSASVTTSAGRDLSVVNGGRITGASLGATSGRNMVLDGMGNMASTGNVTLAAGGTIAETTNAGTTGKISGAQLTTVSTGGQTLGGANTVASFNGTNAGGGNIELANTGATLTLTGINETAGGDIRVTNVGNIGMTGTINTTGDVTLTATGGTIVQSGAGAITNAALLTSDSTGGQTLNGANTVASFSGSNAGGGDVELTNTTPSLTLTGIDETAGGSIQVINTGAMVNAGKVSTTGTVTLNAPDHTITDSGDGTISGNTLDLTAATIGIEPANPLTVRATTILTDATAENAGVSASFNSISPDQPPTTFIVSDRTPGLVLNNNVVVGKTRVVSPTPDPPDPSQLAGSSAILFINARQVDKMLMLTGFEEFFTAASMDSAMFALDQLKSVTSQEVLPGLFPDGTPCQLIGEEN